MCQSLYFVPTELDLLSLKTMLGNSVEHNHTLCTAKEVLRGKAKSILSRAIAP